MPANIQSMSYVGEVPWHKEGKQVPPNISARHMITAAGLDWEVQKRPARGAAKKKSRHGKDIYSRYEIVRLPRPNRDEEEVVLGIVSERYEPLQNVDAFEFFDPIVDQKTATFETAGSLGDGERIWVMARMPGVITAVRGDECSKYLLLSNTHSGQGSVIVKFTAIRVVCQNTLLLSLQDGQPAFRVRHSRKMTERIEEIGDLIAAANKAYERAGAAFQQLARKQIKNRAMLQRYLQALFPRTEAQQKNDTIPPKWQHVEELLETTKDLQLPGVRGTFWAAYNAVTHFEDYRVASSEAASARLNRVWFGRGAELKRLALDEALRIQT